MQFGRLGTNEGKKIADILPQIGHTAAGEPASVFQSVPWNTPPNAKQVIFRWTNEWITGYARLIRLTTGMLRRIPIKTKPICQSTFAMALSHMSTSTPRAVSAWAHMSPVEKGGRQQGGGSVFAQLFNEAECWLGSRGIPPALLGSQWLREC